MSFVLTYEGPLPSRSADSSRAVKNRLRRTFHPQLLEYCEEDQRFWTVPTMGGGIEMGGFRFVGLVGGLFGSNLVAEVKIEMLRRDPPGSIFSGGDIDGRLKTLLDGLRMPQSDQELHGFEPSGDTTRDFCVCLLTDDALVTRVEIVTERDYSPLPHTSATARPDAELDRLPLRPPSGPASGVALGAGSSNGSSRGGVLLTVALVLA